jgi:hypothetical protein
MFRAFVLIAVVLVTATTTFARESRAHRLERIYKSELETMVRTTASAVELAARAVGGGDLRGLIQPMTVILDVGSRLAKISKGILAEALRLASISGAPKRKAHIALLAGFVSQVTSNVEAVQSLTVRASAESRRVRSFEQAQRRRGAIMGAFASILGISQIARHYTGGYRGGYVPRGNPPIGSRMGHQPPFCGGPGVGHTPGPGTGHPVYGAGPGY